MVYQGNPSGRICVGAPWRRAQAWVYAKYTHCAVCGRLVDMSLRRTDPTNRWAPSVDHIIPKSLRPDLALERTNLRLAHFGCNSARGNATHRGRGGGKPRKVTSRDW